MLHLLCVIISINYHLIQTTCTFFFVRQFCLLHSTIWSLRSQRLVKQVLQYLQRYGALSVWICLWNFRFESLLNDFSQRLQWYGFSPVWIRMWLRKLPFWWKPLPQMSQTNSFNSLCVRMCVFRVEDRLKALSHMWHLWGFSDVWIILCRQSVLDKRNPLPHMAQTNGLAPVCDGIFRWIVSVYFVLKVLPHWSHLYGGLLFVILKPDVRFLESSRWCWNLAEFLLPISLSPSSSQLVDRFPFNACGINSGWFSINSLPLKFPFCGNPSCTCFLWSELMRSVLHLILYSPGMFALFASAFWSCNNRLHWPNCDSPEICTIHEL